MSVPGFGAALTGPPRGPAIPKTGESSLASINTTDTATGTAGGTLPTRTATPTVTANSKLVPPSTLKSGAFGDQPILISASTWKECVANLIDANKFFEAYAQGSVKLRESFKRVTHSRTRIVLNRTQTLIISPSHTRYIPLPHTLYHC